MFNKDFYPTPKEVIRKMLRGISVSDKTVYDPSSGKGDILKLCKRRGAKTIGSELNEDLHKFSSEYAKMIGYNFIEITKIEISHVDFIIMNPPFSRDIEHILHAWEIAPSGCIIKALCNQSTLSTGTKNVNRLSSIIEDNGEYTGLGSCFTNAERTTSVEVALITLKKPEVEQEDFSEYFNMTEEDEQQEYGIMPHDAVREIVGRYVGSLKMFKGVEKMSADINDMMSPINMFSINFGCTKLNKHRSVQHLGFNDFKIELQKSAWKTVFGKMNMDKYMTEKLKERINQFVEQQSETPFSRSNIYNMLRFIHNGTAGRMDEVLIEVFDTLTKHYDDNRYHVEGWKTNSHYMINEKMIIPYMTTLRNYGGMDIHYNGNGSKINDLTKALCYITGQNYDDFQPLEQWVSRTRIMDPEFYKNDEETRRKAESSWRHYSTDCKTKEKVLKDYTQESWIEKEIERAIERKEQTYKREFGKWYDWGFFEIKGFKKGTMHFKFKDRKIWELFNRKVAEAKGYELPENL